MRRSNTQSTLVLATLLLCALVTGTPTAAPSNESVAVENYNCPLDCTCTLAQNTHQPHLHARCKSTHDLKSATPLRATLPIHSIDLSYLSLKRLAHALDKLPDLTSIDLSHNELHEIGHLNRHIKKLNLKHNRLTSAKLHKLPHQLQMLNLQHNDITYLPKELKDLRNLMQLELSHNQINCSCETLEVRNWLQERNVYMEQPVVCSYPAETSGKSWLQVKQSDICDKEKRGWYAPEADENELMLGDQPVEGSADNDYNEEEELGKAYLPIDDNKVKSSENNLNDEVEGSGDLGLMNMEVKQSELLTQAPSKLRVDSVPATLVSTEASNVAEVEDEDEDEGSGSGGGILMVPSIAVAPHSSDDFDAPDSESSDDNEYDNKPLEEPTHELPSSEIFKNTDMGIFEGEPSKEEDAVSEEEIVPIVHTKLGVEKQPDVITDAPTGDSRESEAIMTANVKNDDSGATYFLLGVIGLIVLGLILFVAIKRCKHNNNAARDAEAQRQTELLDMDKKNLGKPLPRNGNEHIPLISEKTKLDEAKPINGSGKKPYDAGDVKDGLGQQPLLNGNTNGGGKEATDTVPSIYEPAIDLHQYFPITPRYPTPQSPRASKYAQNAAQGEPNNNNNPDAADAAYLPSSPKSGRYSPVYSPETGRVKIKLTETPKPKTPMLVTRSKSNAGEMITTPVHQTVASVGGAVNGHANH